MFLVFVVYPGYPLVKRKLTEPDKKSDVRDYMCTLCTRPVQYSEFLLIRHNSFSTNMVD